MADKLRLGGMALSNGVLVHGPSAWACAIRTNEGELKVASAHKRYRASDLEGKPLLRGIAKIAEVFALLPQVRRALPQARLPMEKPGVLVAMVASAVTVRVLRGSKLTPAAQELLGGLLALGPAALSLRSGEIAGYHGAEHVSIGTYEHGEVREREHERCGTHLVGPMLATSALGGLLATRAPARFQGPARLAAQLGAVAASTEVFSWMVRNPENPLARALARPGHELQHRLATAEPTHDQLEVAEAALAECLRLEDEHRNQI